MAMGQILKEYLEFKGPAARDGCKFNGPDHGDIGF
jgi:hypothetical protein